VNDLNLEPYLPLSERIAAMRAQKGASVTVGIQGPQGAGKTTLVTWLQRTLGEQHCLSVACLSIDDIYFTRAERAELAARVHPLLVTRGVPGTHDVELGVRTLRALTQPGPVAIPRFDKARDDRAPKHAWPVVEGPCDVILFEGLWIGLPALDERTLDVPFNALEAQEDPASVWRRHAARELSEHYPALFAPCELLVHLQVPDFDCVKRWRSGAEHALRARLEAEGADTSRVMDAQALARFFDHYERFTAHAMQAMPGRADIIVRLDDEHRVVNLRASR
jgi:D-glycerate 3-kinase